MREIKFRAWDESDKEMIEDFQFFKSGDSNADWIIPKHKVWEDIRGDNNTVEMNKYPHMRQQFVVMQWTGLTDRNGKEIYESDIIQYDNERYEVYWSQDWAMFTVVGPQVQALMRYAEYGEVIGNVFERDAKLQKDS